MPKNKNIRLSAIIEFKIDDKFQEKPEEGKQMAKDKKTARKISKKVAEILNESKLAKEAQSRKQAKPEWDTVRTTAPIKSRPSKKRG